MNPTTGVLTTGGDIKIDSQTLEQCLKSTSNFSGTLVQNICTGQHYLVPLGFWDYAVYFTLIALGISFALLLLFFAFKVLTDF